MRRKQSSIPIQPADSTTRPSEIIVDRLLSPRELAALVGVGTHTLETWRHRKVGPPFLKISHSCARYRLSDVEKWLASRQVRPAAPANDNAGNC